jgi:hypothetical protein
MSPSRSRRCSRPILFVEHEVEAVPLDVKLNALIKAG